METRLIEHISSIFSITSLCVCVKHIYDRATVYFQLESMPRITLQTMAAALVCVGTVLFLFTPHWSIIVPGVCCVLSINLGVFGLFYYWDIDLDPISMTTTVENYYIFA